MSLSVLLSSPAISVYVVCAFLAPAALIVAAVTVGFERSRDVGYASLVLFLLFSLLLPLAVYHRGALLESVRSQRERAAEGAQVLQPARHSTPAGGHVPAHAPVPAPVSRAAGSPP